MVRQEPGPCNGQGKKGKEKEMKKERDITWKAYSALGADMQQITYLPRNFPMTCSKLSQNEVGYHFLLTTIIKQLAGGEH